MKWNRIAAFALAFCLILTGCSLNGREEVSATPSAPPVRTPAPADTPAPAETHAVTPGPEPEPAPTPEPGGPVAVRPAPMPTPEAEPSPEPTFVPVPKPVPTPVPPAPTPVPGPEATPAPEVTSAPEAAPGPEPEGALPTDEQVLEAYRKAREAYAWFYRETLPCLDEPLERDGTVYYPVDYPGLSVLADLQGYLKTLFSDEIVDALLPAGGEQYVEVDGRLYVRPGIQAPDPTRGAAEARVLRGDGTLAVEVTVQLLDPERDYAPAGSETHVFPYARVGDKWLFTEFYLCN